MWKVAQSSNQEFIIQIMQILHINTVNSINLINSALIQHKIAIDLNNTITLANAIGMTFSKTVFIKLMKNFIKLLNGSN